MAQGKELINLQLLNAALDLREGRGLGETLGRAGQAGVLMNQLQQKQTAANLDNMKKMLEIQKMQAELPGQTGVPERSYPDQQRAQDELLPEAFGVLDVLEQKATTVLGSFGIGPAKGYEAQIAKAAKDNLNYDIKIIAADAFKGKPSNFLLTQIEELLPTGFAGDPNAAAKYGVIQSNFKSRLTELEDEVKLAKKGSKTQLDLIKQRANVQHIIRRLDTVMNAFTGKTPTKAKSLYNITGIQPGMELPTDEESLDALALEWKKTTGLEDDLN